VRIVCCIPGKEAIYCAPCPNAIPIQGETDMSLQIPTPVPPTEHRILRRADVEAKTGFKRAHLYGLMKEGKFPKALRLGLRAVG
jgi:prophage regulatory protein